MSIQLDFDTITINLISIMYCILWRFQVSLAILIIWVYFIYAWQWISNVIYLFLTGSRV